MSNTGIRRLTQAAPLVASCLGCCGVLLWTAPVVRVAAAGVLDPRRSPDRLLGQSVVLVAAAALAALCCWFLASVLACSLAALRTAPGRRTSAGDAGSLLRPRLVRVLVTAALGTAVTATGQGAQAGGRPELPQRLEGLAVPDRTYGGVRTHEVTAGESLWSITADRLPSDVDAVVVAHAWPRLHRLNLDRVGDPDVLHPGTVLRLPVRASAPTRGAPR